MGVQERGGIRVAAICAGFGEGVWVGVDDECIGRRIACCGRAGGDGGWVVWWCVPEDGREEVAAVSRTVDFRAQI